MNKNLNKYIIKPDPNNELLTEEVTGTNHNKEPVRISVTVERPLTLFLNGQEIVTMMTICDYPEYLAVGYLLNQNMIGEHEVISDIEFHADIETIVVRTNSTTNFEEKLKKKTLTSGCAQGTVFGDVMEKFDKKRLPKNASLKTSWLYKVMKSINTVPSLYLSAGAIHGCVLCKEDNALIYMEDVGRHNAVDKIAGYMFQENISSSNKYFYTTGRLTSEMVIKTVQMGIPILVSRSGFTAWGVALAREVGLTLIGRARGNRFIALAGESRIVFDADSSEIDGDSSAKKESVR